MSLSAIMRPRTMGVPRTRAKSLLAAETRVCSKRILGAADDIEARLHAHAGKRQGCGQGGVLDAGKAVHPVQHGCIDQRGHRWRRIGGVCGDGHIGEAGSVGGHGGEGGHALDINAEVGLLQVPKSVEEQAGADQQDSGKRNFAGDERAAEAAADSARSPHRARRPGARLAGWRGQPAGRATATTAPRSELQWQPA